MRSGFVTVVIVGCALLGLTVAFRAHQQGNFHKLKVKANITTDQPVDSPAARPGGQEPIVLLRSQMAGDLTPQFLSMTLLPGRGMNVLQITAFIPGRGEVKLLASPTADAAAAAMTGTGNDAHGEASLTMGGAFEAPWAGDIQFGAGRGTAQQWDGRPIPAAIANNASPGGLMLASGADSADSEALPDGGTAHAVFHAGDFGGRWISKTDVTVNALLSSRTIEFTVLATNVGDVAEPFGIGWLPRFAIDAGQPATVSLHIPAQSKVEMHGGAKNIPTGRLIPAGGTGDFAGANRAALSFAGPAGVDVYYADLQQRLLDNGPAADWTNRAGGYRLRLTAMSAKMRVMRVVVPADGHSLSIDAAYNLPDPFGREWAGDSAPGMVTLDPGQTTEWKVRLELSALEK